MFRDVSSAESLSQRLVRAFARNVRKRFHIGQFTNILFINLKCTLHVNVSPTSPILPISSKRRKRSLWERLSCCTLTYTKNMHVNGISLLIYLLKELLSFLGSLSTGKALIIGDVRTHPFFSIAHFLHIGRSSMKLAFIYQTQVLCLQGQVKE